MVKKIVKWLQLKCFKHSPYIQSIVKKEIERGYWLLKKKYKTKKELKDILNKAIEKVCND